MNALTREVIVGALSLLADRLQPGEPRVELIIVGPSLSSFPDAR